MPNKLSIWYKQLHPRWKLAIIYIGYFIFWYFGGILFELIFEDQRTLGYNLFHAGGMALTWTLLFHWSTFRSVFKKKKEDNLNQENAS